MVVLTAVDSRGPSLIEHQSTQRYFDSKFSREAVKILPGEFFVTTRDMLLVTVLGSCVAACIRDPERGIGGMNHFMLPDGGTGATSRSARYGGYAMELLVNELIKSGARRSALEAKVFGGGRVMASLSSANVGERNSSFVLDYLQQEGIPVIAQDLQEKHARKIYFFPRVGRVLVKKLARVNNDTLARREREYQERLARTDASGDIELFS
ncbi:chemoreceptor glutamine deamidase CheD [Methyloversatilis sp.]|uniref:chemoreceptor glutamine deamidase CheD n=1 Tax=Methyloversatilis sp. TaxID=2569862 RepID=UPI0027326CBA|nr:chemoreceptor glutamine deamidase CheD [Methyloversatilis sp.]MDP2868173.1 chemoreceptor glutamine deamidase CheD [Methyloversatilis sp.]MDP3288583.1 chemoreceptor glutamine deamidase CheD [Methyloversatilis sp.]MDP3455318.1 chemoreceptor glutamine deamidase CheD [Methyloversatilis sp.]MDP3578512.1 chemoreceptor glutamine deamidase CheD [Methyloversatilis sp.]